MIPLINRIIDFQTFKISVFDALLQGLPFQKTNIPDRLFKNSHNAKHSTKMKFSSKMKYQSICIILFIFGSEIIFAQSAEQIVETYNVIYFDTIPSKKFVTDKKWSDSSDTYCLVFYNFQNDAHKLLVVYQNGTKMLYYLTQSLGSTSSNYADFFFYVATDEDGNSVTMSGDNDYLQIDFDDGERVKFTK